MYIFSLLSPQRSNNKRAQSTYLFSAMVLRDTIQENSLGKADAENMQAQTQICLVPNGTSLKDSLNEIHFKMNVFNVTLKTVTE